jgi:hypothetical protein
MLTWKYCGNPEAFAAYDEIGYLSAVILRKLKDDGSEDVVTYVRGQEIDVDSKSDWHDSETLKNKQRLVEEWLPHVEVKLENEMEWGKNRLT